MKKIGTVKTTKEILEKNGFMMKKKYGQNFLIDQNVLASIVEKAEIDKNINVIEIGPGIGSLTEHLLEKANRVIAYEIDNKLIPILNEQFAEYSNFTLINKDILKADVNTDIKEYFNDGLPVYLVANLPYYITTPIIIYLLEKVKTISRYVVMVQSEVADRFTACKGSKDYNNLSILIQYHASVKKAINVSRNVFTPKPNVDSAVVIFDLYNPAKYNLTDEEAFFKFVRNAFANRRKTLINNLSSAYNINKDELATILKSINIDPLIRSEAISLDDFIFIYNKAKTILPHY